MSQNIKFIQVAAGKTHSLGLDIKRQIWAWGDNSRGQLGIKDDTIQTVNNPTLLETFSKYEIKEIVVGECFSGALDVAGYLWTWGCNEHGQLGDGTTISRSEPGLVIFPQPIQHIAAGEYGIEVYVNGIDETFKFWATDGINNVPDAKLFIETPTPLIFSTQYGITIITPGRSINVIAKPSFIHDRKLYIFDKWLDQKNQNTLLIYNPSINPYVSPISTELKYRNLHITNDSQDIGTNYIALYSSKETQIEFKFYAESNDGDLLPITFLKSKTGFTLYKYHAEKLTRVGDTFNVEPYYTFTNSIGEYTFLYWLQKDITGNRINVSDINTDNPHVRTIGSESVNRNLFLEDTLIPINKTYYAIYDVNYFEGFLIYGKTDNGVTIKEDPKIFLENPSIFTISSHYATKYLLTGDSLNVSVFDNFLDSNGNSYIFKYWEDYLGNIISDDKSQSVYSEAHIMEFKKRKLNIYNDGVITKMYVAIYEFIKKENKCILNFESKVTNISHAYNQPVSGNVFDVVGTLQGCWKNSDQEYCSYIIKKGEIFRISAKPRITINNKLYVFENWMTETGSIIDFSTQNPKLLNNYTLEFNYLYDKPDCVMSIHDPSSFTYIGLSKTNSLFVEDIILNGYSDSRLNLINYVFDLLDISENNTYKTLSSDIKSLTDTIVYYVENFENNSDNLNIIYISDLQDGNNEFLWWDRINDAMDDKDYTLNIDVLKISADEFSNNSINTMNSFIEFRNQKPDYVNEFNINVLNDYPIQFDVIKDVFNTNSYVCTCPSSEKIVKNVENIQCEINDIVVKNVFYLGRDMSQNMLVNDINLNGNYQNRSMTVSKIITDYNINNDLIYDISGSSIKKFTDLIVDVINNHGDEVTGDFLNILFLNACYDGDNESIWWERIDSTMSGRSFKLNLYILRIIGEIATQQQEYVDTNNFFQDFGNQKPNYVNKYEIYTISEYKSGNNIINNIINKNIQGGYECNCSNSIIKIGDANNIEEAQYLAKDECINLSTENICRVKPVSPICGKYIANYRFEIVDCKLIFTSELDDGVVPDSENIFNTVGTISGCWEDTFDMHKKCYKDMYPNEKFSITAQQYFTYNGILYQFDKWLTPSNTIIKETQNTNAIQLRNNNRTIDFDNNGDLQCGEYVAMYKTIGWEDDLNCGTPLCNKLTFRVAENTRYPRKYYECIRRNNRNVWVHYKTTYDWRNHNNYGTCYRNPITINGQRTTCWMDGRMCASRDNLHYKLGHKINGKWICSRSWSKGQDIDVSIVSGFGGRNFIRWLGKNFLTIDQVQSRLQQKRNTEDPNNPPQNPISIPRSPYALSSNMLDIKFFGSEYDVTGTYFCKFYNRTESTAPPPSTSPPVAGCFCHMSGLLVGGSTNNGYVKIFDPLLGHYCDILGPGEYPNAKLVMPNAHLGTFDGLAIGPNVTQIIWYSEPNFSGNIVLDISGPMVVNNSRFQSDSIYGPSHNIDYPSELQSIYPQENRMWSVSEMRDWVNGSFKIICGDPDSDSNDDPSDIISISNIQINQVRAILNVIEYYNNNVVFMNEDEMAINIYEDFKTGELYLIIVFEGISGSANVEISGVPENAQILLSSATQTGDTVTGTYTWNNNRTGLIIGNIDDFSVLNINVNNPVGFDQIKLYSPNNRKLYSSANITPEILPPDIVMYDEKDLDLTYYLTHYDYDLSNFILYTNSKLVFINNSNSVQMLSNDKNIKKCGWIYTDSPSVYQIIDINYVNKLITLDRQYTETSSTIIGNTFYYHEPENTYWFENGSNVVVCNNLSSVNSIAVGSKIYSETDNDEIYVREVIDKIVIYDPLIPDPNYKNVFKLILDDNYTGTTTSTLCGERIYFQKPQYKLTIIADVKGIVISEPGGIYADESVDNHVYNSGIVTLYAFPKIGYEFKSWSGSDSGNDPVLDLNLNKNKVIRAEFSRIKICVGDDIYLQTEWDRRYYHLESDESVLIYFDENDSIHQLHPVHHTITIEKDCSYKHCGYYRPYYRRKGRTRYTRVGTCPGTFSSPTTRSPEIGGPPPPSTTEPTTLPPENCQVCFSAEAHGLSVIDDNIKVFDIGNTSGCWNKNTLEIDKCCKVIEGEITEIEAIEFFEVNGVKYWFKFWKYLKTPVTNYEDKTDTDLSPFTHKINIDDETNRLLRFDTDVDRHCGEYVAYYEPQIPYCETCFQAAAESLVISDPEIKTFNFGDQEGCWDINKLEQRGCCKHIQNINLTVEANLFFRIGNRKYEFQYWLGPNGIVIPIEDKTQSTNGPYTYKPFELADVHNKLVFENTTTQHCGLYVAYYSSEQEIIKTPEFQAPIQTVKSAAGYHHMIALEGTVHPDDAEIITSYMRCWSWGKNYYGQLGLGNYSDKTYPHIVEFPDDTILEHIHCGAEHSLGIDQYGRGWAWGDNRYCQLGIDVNIEHKNRPTLIRVPEDKQLKDLKGGIRHTIALTVDNHVYIWGHSQCGEGVDPHPLDPSEINMPDGINFEKMFAGEDYYSGITSDGDVYMWGNNLFGQLGIGNYDNQEDPQIVIFPEDVVIVDMSLNTTHTLALDSKGNIWTWGDNRQEQLGDQTKINKNTPYHMTGFSKEPLDPTYIKPVIPTFPSVNLNTTEPYNTLNITVNGEGKVKSNPAGINCGLTCSAQFNEDVSIVLHAYPDNGYKFDRWEGDITGRDEVSEEILITTNKNITAVFIRNKITIEGIEYTQSTTDPRYWYCPNNIRYWINENELVQVYGKDPVIEPVLYTVNDEGYRHVVFKRISAGDGYSYAWDYKSRAYTWGLLSPYHKYTTNTDNRELLSEDKLYLLINNMNKNLGVVRNIDNTSVNTLNEIDCGNQCIDEYYRNSMATVECVPFSGITEDDQSVLTKTIVNDRLQIIHLGDGYGNLHIFRNSDDYFEIQADPESNSVFKRMFGDLYNSKHDYGLVYDNSSDIKTIYVEFDYASEDRLLKIDSKYFTVEDPVNSIYCENSVQEFNIPKDTLVNLELINIKEGYTFKGWSGSGVSNTESSRTILMNNNQEIYLEWDNLYERITLLNHDPAIATITHNADEDNGEIIVDKYEDLELYIEPIGSVDILSFEYENVVVELYYGSCDFILSKINQRLVIEAVLDGNYEFDRWEGEYSAKDGLNVSVNISERKRYVSIWFKK